MASVGVYLIRDINTNRIYVGASRDVEARWKWHRSKIIRKCHHSPRMSELDPEKIECEILEVCDSSITKRELATIEQRYYDKLKPELNARNAATGFGKGKDHPFWGKKGPLNPNWGKPGMKGQLHPNWGKPGKKGGDHPRAVRVIELNSGMIFDSRIEAAEFFGLFPQHISQACLGRKEHVKGYRFAYA